MRFGRQAALLSLLALAGVRPACAGAWDGLADELRAGETGLVTRPERWETRFASRRIDELLRHPEKAPPALKSWAAEISAARAPSELLAFSARLLDVEAPPPRAGSAELRGCPELPAELRRTIAELAGAAASAQAVVSRAAAALTPAQRERALSAMQGAAGDDAPAPPDFLNGLERFDLGAMLAAARAMSLAVERAIPELEASAWRKEFSGRARCESAAGDVLVGGAGDDVYAAEDLKDAVLVVDMGGDNRYLGPAAVAGPGELRVVVDLGKEDAFEAGAGAARFGVGLLSAPETGVKRLSAGDGALGAGLFGVGVCSLPRGAAVAHSGALSQGAGAFGVGIFEDGGENAVLSAGLASQGYGLTRGVGLLRHRGASAKIMCGLDRADPREPLGLQSVCQGTGFGLRAAAAGGFGLASLETSGSTITASYFAQGSGYWRALGALWLKGDDNRLLARRYAQGAGVHFAAGALTVEGDGNRIAAWGVGPGVGWDFSVGLFELRGDRNAVQSEWNSGHAEINARVFASVAGDDNRLALAGFGSGAFKKGAASYSMAQIDGRRNRLRAPGLAAEVAGDFDLRQDPWGILRARGLTLDPRLELEKVDWPASAGDAKASARGEALRRRLEEALAAPGTAAVPKLLEVAASSALDGGASRAAAERLIALGPAAAAPLVEALSAENFDELMWARLLLSSLGETGASAARAAMGKSAPLKSVLLFGLSSYGRAEAALAPCLAALKSGDWRLRRAAAGVLGALLDAEKGDEPGRLSTLGTALEFLDSGKPSIDAAAWGKESVNDLYAVLSLDPSLSEQARAALLARTANPFEPANEHTLAEFVAILSSGAPAYRAALRRERDESVALKEHVRKALNGSLADPDAEVRAAALLGLGGIGAPEDVGRLVEGCGDPEAVAREATASALSKAGAVAREALAAALTNGTRAGKECALLAAAQSPDAETERLLKKGFGDSDERVRRLAASAVSALPGVAAARRKEFVGDLRRLAESDPSPSVRATAAVALAAIPL